jgi:preprotein translocase subunit Sss1
MWNPFSPPDNAWIEADRREFRRIVNIALILGITVLSGVGFLIYGLTQ